MSNVGFEILFTDPKDPRWRIIKEAGGSRQVWMDHNCGRNYMPGGTMYVGACCMHCGDEWNKEFQGFAELVKLGHDEQI